MTINATASILLCLYIAVAERQGVASARLSGTVQNDILKEYIARGTYVFPPGPSMRLVTDTFAFCRERVPRWNTISISGYHVREAGCTAVQEVAFTLSNGIAYVNAALEAGLRVDDFARQLSFFFNAHNNLLEEVAKFRAARRLWARVMRDRFGAKDPRSLMLRFHAQTAGSTLTAQQPENNVVRVTLQALAAVLGGCQSLHTNSMDEALALPTEAAVRVALRTQQILAHESGVADTIDPLGGSYAVERLTRQIEEEAESYIAKIDGLGGSVHAIAFMQREIQEAAYRYQLETEQRARVVVGVNEYVTDEPPPHDLFQLDPHLADALAERLARLRKTRDLDAARRALDAVDRAARGRENLLGPILDAVRAHATLGEICDTLRRVFGVHQPSVVFCLDPAFRPLPRDVPPRHLLRRAALDGARSCLCGVRDRDPVEVRDRRRRWGAVVAVALWWLIAWTGSACAGIADEVGATFGLMLQDVVSAFPAVEGLVVAVDGEQVYMDLTEKDGVQIGQEYTIFRKGEVFRHPMTGRPMGRFEEIIGYAQVKRVLPQFSEAAYVAAAGQAPSAGRGRRPDHPRADPRRGRAAHRPHEDECRPPARLVHDGPCLGRDEALPGPRSHGGAGSAGDPEDTQRGTAGVAGEGRGRRPDPRDHRMARARADRTAWRDLPRRDVGLRHHGTRALFPARRADPGGDHDGTAVSMGARSSRLSRTEAKAGASKTGRICYAGMVMRRGVPVTWRREGVRLAVGVCAVGVLFSGCVSIRELAGLPAQSDPSVTLRATEPRWVLIKNPRFGDVASEPEYIWVEEDKIPTTMKTLVMGKNSIIAPPSIVAKYGSPPGGGRISPRQGGPYKVENLAPTVPTSSSPVAALPLRPGSMAAAAPRRRRSPGAMSSTWTPPGSSSI